MDEVLFRSSDKLEALQYKLGVAATEGKKIISEYSAQSKTVISHYLNTSSANDFQEKLKHVCVYILQFFEELRSTLVDHIQPERLYNSLVNWMQKSWVNKHIFIGVSGLCIGGILGFYIGRLCYQNHTVFRYVQAVHCISYSGLDGVSYVDDAILPKSCVKNEVLVSVKAGSVQMLDLKICEGYGKRIRKMFSKNNTIYKGDLPLTLGRDCTGIITEIGPEVTRLEIGDEIWLTVPFWENGTLAQNIITKDNYIALKPKKLGFEAACSFPYAGSVALNKLNEAKITEKNIKSKRIFIHGGWTPVGCFLVQILNAWGAHVTTSCYDRTLPVLKALGAHKCVILPEENGEICGLSDTMKHLRGELDSLEEFNYIFNTNDCGWTIRDFGDYCSKKGAVFETTAEVIHSDNYGTITGCLFTWSTNLKIFMKSIFGINSSEVPINHTTLDTLSKLIEKEQLKPVVDKVFHAVDIERALNHIKSGSSIGSTVITFR